MTNENGVGVLEVGTNEAHEVVINLPRDMTGHIVFSPRQARELAYSLTNKSIEAERAAFIEAEAKRVAAVPPVDRSARVLTDGSAVTDDHREINPVTGQQKEYVVLSARERAKGFVRPVRRTYKHVTCGSTTTMSHDIAETYARDPAFYSGTFCLKCRSHFPLDQFTWIDDGTQVGS